MIPVWYNDYKKLIDESINKYLNLYFSRWEISESLELFKDSIYYSVKWWKRIRSILALEFYIISSWKKINKIKFWDDIISYCIALELLHAYSLVHDDLPCMDNDEFRRWQETVWKKYWDDIATLSWDLLNSMSFEILSELNSDIDIRMLISYFWRSVWIYWMIWWQVLDVYYEKNSDKLNIEKLIEVHNKKTWALIEASIIWWAILWHTSEDIGDYMKFWKNIWLAFQIKDDILDEEWTKEETGKSVWWENKGFVYFMWLEKTKLYLEKLIIESLELIIPLKSEKLIFLVNYIWNRNK